MKATFLKLIIFFVLYLLVLNSFGSENTITQIFADQILWTPYNIVGAIMVLGSFCGIFIGSLGGAVLLKVIIIFDIVNLFGINLLNLIFIGVISILAKIALGILGLVLAILGIIFLIKFISWLIETISFNRNYRYSSLSLEKSVKRLQNKNKKMNTAKIDNLEKVEIPEKVEEYKEKVESTLDCSSRTDYEIEISKNICPLCGNYLTKRKNNSDNSTFRGCMNYGRTGCNFTISDKEYLRIWHKYNG